MSCILGMQNGMRQQPSQHPKIMRAPQKIQVMFPATGSTLVIMVSWQCRHCICIGSGPRIIVVVIVTGPWITWIFDGPVSWPGYGGGGMLFGSIIGWVSHKITASLLLMRLITTVMRFNAYVYFKFLCKKYTHLFNDVNDQLLLLLTTLQ